ncbi:MULTISPECIES: hypothetical protein [unclassified Bradyrhizobium]|uniref:hypothetical protein n=1 Tax=unclassified Bradyrhizobium TaxID=2631580 RepID=UPI001FF75D86|nr:MULTISPECIES: hypothetical protein [unclassified Bradyrhizobium]MCK1332822.1 hypothetical protein [Bradyrhizobium sp. CW9]MCK1698605.1 hypothetical protein [Bradyrhizobium sp. 144]
MTDEFEEWNPREQPAWAPKTPREEREPLNSAPFATLGATPISDNAFRLMGELANRYPRPQATNGKTYARKKTLVHYAHAGGALIAELLAAIAADRSEGWIRCSRRKSDYTGRKDVSWAMFDSVSKAWLEAELVEEKKGYPGMLAMGNPGPTSGKLTRYRATPKLLEIAAAHDITPANVLEHFKFEFSMPSELIQLSQPSELTPNTERVAKLREQIAELNAFSAKHTLTHPTRTIQHLGWVRMFHGYTEGFKWDKGGRLYSKPQGVACYQSLSASKMPNRQDLRIDGERVVELDISSSYLTIFYALCDEQLDLGQDAYRGILGHTDLDRLVAKLWINASLSIGRPLRKWSGDLIESLQNQLATKQLTGFDKKQYPMKFIGESVLQRHPLLARLGGPIRGRTINWADLMYHESEAIIGAMLTLKRDHQTPSYPVHDSLIVPVSKYKVAREALIHHFRVETGKVPRVKPEVDPEDW